MTYDSGYLARYALFFAARNADPLLLIELSGHIVSFVDPLVIHGFVSGVAHMVYHKRKDRFPFCSQESDWYKTERLFHEKHSRNDIRLLSIKCLMLATYCVCIDKGRVFPSIEGAIQGLGVSDEKILPVLEDLTNAQCHVLFTNVGQACLSDEAVQLFLAREIAEFYMEFEGEILKLFEISC